MAYEKSELTSTEESYQHSADTSVDNQAAGSNSNTFLKYFPISSKKLPLTIIYCIAFWNFGICVAIFGPTLLDLACQTSSTLSAMSLLYFMQNFTSLLGCFISGLLIKNKK